MLSKRIGFCDSHPNQAAVDEGSVEQPNIGMRVRGGFDRHPLVFNHLFKRIHARFGAATEPFKVP